MDATEPISERDAAFEAEFAIDGYQFVELFKLIVGKDLETNTWNVFPLSVFTESAIMYDIGVMKKDAETVHDSLTVLSEGLLKHESNPSLLINYINVEKQPSVVVLENLSPSSVDKELVQDLPLVWPIIAAGKKDLKVSDANRCSGQFKELIQKYATKVLKLAGKKLRFKYTESTKTGKPKALWYILYKVHTHIIKQDLNSSRSDSDIITPGRVDRLKEFASEYMPKAPKKRIPAIMKEPDPFASQNCSSKFLDKPERSDGKSRLPTIHEDKRESIMSETRFTLNGIKQASGGGIWRGNAHLNQVPDIDEEQNEKREKEARSGSRYHRNCDCCVIF